MKPGVPFVRYRTVRRNCRLNSRGCDSFGCARARRRRMRVSEGRSLPEHCVSFAPGFTCTGPPVRRPSWSLRLGLRNGFEQPPGSSCRFRNVPKTWRGDLGKDLGPDGTQGLDVRRASARYWQPSEQDWRRKGSRIDPDRSPWRVDRGISGRLDATWLSTTCGGGRWGRFCRERQIHVFLAVAQVEASFGARDHDDIVRRRAGVRRDRRTRHGIFEHDARHARPAGDEDSSNAVSASRRSASRRYG